MVGVAYVACPEAAHLVGGLEEVVEGALGVYASVLEDDDAVGAAQGGAAVGDDEGGGVLAVE